MSESVRHRCAFEDDRCRGLILLTCGKRVVEAVEGGASRREAADRFEISPSSAIKGLQRWRASASVAAKPSDGSIWPLEEHASWLLALIAEQPGLTLDEVVAAMGKRRINGSRTAVSRFFCATRSALKKACAQRSKRAPTWPGRAGAGSDDKAFLTRPRRSSSTRPRPPPISCGFEDAARAASDLSAACHTVIGRRSPWWRVCARTEWSPPA
jgi:transposase